MIDVTPFLKPCSTKILPLVYEDSLSYYEDICKVREKINEVINALNIATEDILAQAKVYTDSAIASGLAGVDSKIDELNRLADELRIDYTDFQNLINLRVALIGTRVDALDSKIDAEIIGANEYTRLAIEQNNDFIIDEVSKELTKLKVTNYFTGGQVTVQEMFDYLAQFHLENAITYTELAERSKTVTELIAYNMTYTQLALNGGAIIQ